jgi:hypothetical protein
MNPETPDEPNDLNDLRNKGREIATAAQDRASDALHEVEYQIRRNPWLFIGGALVVGVAIAALCPRHRREPEKLEVVRDWLRDAYDGVASRVPDRDDIKSAVDSLDLPGRLGCLRKKLHLG